MGLYGSTPQAPDPAATANAQFNFDMGASQASSIINNPNTYDPYGQTNYKVSGYETVTLPNGKQVQVPRYDKTTTLTKAGQGLLDQQQTLGKQAFGTAQQQLGRSSTAGVNPWQTSYGVGDLNTNFSGNTGSQSFNPAGQYTGQKNTAGTDNLSGLIRGFDLQDNYAKGKNFSDDRVRVENAMYGRANRAMQEGRDSEVARLAAMGLAPGGEAYGRVADQYGRDQNDLAMAAVLAGGQEQSRLLGEDRARATFGNQSQLAELAARQGVMESENARRFNETNLFNTANQSQFAMKTALTEMENARRTGDMNAYNAALEAYNNAQIAETMLGRDAANFNNTTRAAQVGERESMKDSSINRLISILSGAQVQNPQMPGYNPQGIQAPDYSGLVSSNYANQVAAHNAKLGAISGIIGGGSDILTGSKWWGG